MTQSTADNEDATKKDDEDPRTGERWEDHNGRRFTAEIVPDGIQLHYDDGRVEGPFLLDEFNRSREELDYLGIRDE